MTVKERFELLALAEGDKDFREVLARRCAQDTAFFINLCCWTFDPRLRPADRRYLPFMLFGRQEEYVAELEAAIAGDYDLITVKSRDMGATWLNLAVFLKHWLFEPGFAGHMGSDKEEKTDKKGDSACLFWKFEFMVENLPPWLKPQGYKADQPWRTFLKIVNPVTRSVITGESANSNFGRGGRYSAIFLDEFSSWDWAASAWAACGESTNCRLPNSTPQGMNFFGQLANPRDPAGGTTRVDLDWRDDPRHAREEKDPATGEMVMPWYESRKKRYAYDPAMLAQELERDFGRSVRGRVYPQIDYVALGRYAYNEMCPLYAAWDFGTSDDTAIGWFQWKYARNRFEMIDYYQNSGQMIAFYVPLFTGLVPSGVPWEYQEADIAAIRRHEGWVVQGHYGDPAGRQRNPVTNTSVLMELAKADISVTTNTQAVRFETRIQAGRKLLTRLAVDEVRCQQFLDAMRNAKFPQRPEGSQSMQQAAKPVHDWTSHARSMFEYFAVNETHTGGAWNDPDEVNAPASLREAMEDEDDRDPVMGYRGIAGY